MLKELHIENIAVIERADIDFTSGLSVLSGETGAGKSIIIDSINAVLGNRVSRDIIRHGADSARVTAVFEYKKLPEWLKENDIDVIDDIILQRKITSDGKSSCRICGVPVTAAQMRELASQLIDIHGQNDGLRLLDEKSHLDFLDRFGTDETVKSKYDEEFATISGMLHEIRALSMDENEKSRISESLKYTIDEIEKLKIKPGEYESLIEKRDLLRNSEKLKEALDSALSFLSEGEGDAITSSSNALFFASKAAAIRPDLEEASNYLSEAQKLLKNSLSVLNDARESLDFSDMEYDQMEHRISEISRIIKKYDLEPDNIIAYVDDCKHKLNEIQYSGDKLARLKSEFLKQKEICIKAASDLSANRKRVATILQERIVSELRDLNMPSVKFIVDFAPVTNSYGFDKNGSDTISFLMSANAGENVGKISRIASGGELSRIMLALKNVFAEKDTVDTMIFDEIDSGISGISAQRVAEKLYTVSKNKQVMCISHLPQIAAMADNEYLVLKSESDGRTFTKVSRLDLEGRKREIARMYGGDNITETTLNAAAEQLIKSEEFKKNV